MFINHKIIYPLTLATPSQFWTSQMTFMKKICSELNVRFVWIQHTKSFNTKIENSFDSINNIDIVKVESPANHAEVFFAEALKKLNLSTWYLRIDDDEIIEKDGINNLLNLIENLRTKHTYSINRLWVKLINNAFYFSHACGPKDSHLDWQIRIFHSSNLKEDNRIHSPGVVAKKSKKISSDIYIYHLIWEIESFESRVKKIQNYNSISPHAGTSKIRYYLPELLDNLSHNWERINAKAEQVLFEWSDFHKNN